MQRSHEQQRDNRSTNEAIDHHLFLAIVEPIKNSFSQEFFLSIEKNFFFENYFLNYSCDRWRCDLLD